MLVFGHQPETLPVSVQQDATTGLPLLSERDAIIQVVLAYLALPYSVVAYGCGKKSSLIIDQLIGMGIPLSPFPGGWCWNTICHPKPWLSRIIETVPTPLWLLIL